MEIKEIKITRPQLETIYEDFKAIDRSLGIIPADSRRIELAVKSISGELAAYASGLVEYELFYISDLWVRADSRRKGLGSKILAALEQRAREAACKEAYLWTAGEDNAGFYRTGGYSEFVCFEDAFGLKGHHKYGFRKAL